MRSDSVKNMSAYADQNHAPSLAVARLEQNKKHPAAITSKRNNIDTGCWYDDLDRMSKKRHPALSRQAFFSPPDWLLAPELHRISRMARGLSPPVENMLISEENFT